jgi:hypothetical protein
MASGIGLFMGTCSGHGLGAGSSHHPGLGGSILPGCQMPPYDPKIIPKPVQQMDAVTSWLPHPQLPLGVAKALSARVVVNGNIPMVDQDILIPHPTLNVHTVSYTGIPKGCPPGVTPNPAHWCTFGVTGGREAPVGHARKILATAKTVFIGKVRVSKFGDPMGDRTPAFPCNSVVTGCSPNVFIEMSGGGIT